MQGYLDPLWSRKMRFFSFVSMLLLVYVHGYNLDQRYLQPFSVLPERMTFTTFTEFTLANGVFRFRIPMLFAISGFLFALHDEKPFWRRIGGRFRTLIIPYYLWSAIGLLIAFCLLHWDFTRSAVQNAHLHPVLDNGFNPAKGEDWAALLLWPLPFQLWFIRCLFFYNLLYPVFRWCVTKAPLPTFLVLGFLWLSSFGFFFVEGEGMLSFTLGVWLCKRGKDLGRRPRWFSLPVFTLIFLGAAVAKTLLAFHYGPQFPDPWKPMPESVVIPLMLLHKLVIASGLLVAWFGLDKLAETAMKSRVFVRLSDYSFMIYALHVPLVTYLIDPVHGLLRQLPNYRFLTFLFLPLAVIVFCVAVGAGLRAALPGLYALLTGNRGLTRLKPAPVAASGEVTLVEKQPTALS